MSIVASPLAVGDAVCRTIVAAGEPYVATLRAGQHFRILDLEGNQAVDTLFYDAHDPGACYSAVDTIRAQGNIYLTAGSRLLSKRGDLLATITADTCGRHDTLGGACSAESNTVRYALDKRHMHSCRDNFLLALAYLDSEGRWGMGKRNLSSNINFFMNVPVTPAGGLTFADGISAAGRYVELQAARDLLVLISNCPQLNNPCNAYDPTPIGVFVWDPLPGDDDRV
ncbi:MAG: urea amidolyase associated protein UAAP2 [Pseudomonadales bacterium]